MRELENAAELRRRIQAFTTEWLDQDLSLGDLETFLRLFQPIPGAFAASTPMGAGDIATGAYGWSWSTFGPQNRRRYQVSPNLVEAFKGGNRGWIFFPDYLSIKFKDTAGADKAAQVLWVAYQDPDPSGAGNLYPPICGLGANATKRAVFSPGAGVSLDGELASGPLAPVPLFPDKQFYIYFAGLIATDVIMWVMTGEWRWHPQYLGD